MMQPRELHLHGYTTDEIMCLPAAEELSELSALSGDVFICALGFEQRCTTIAARLQQAVTEKIISPYSFSLYARYPTNATDNAENSNLLEKCLSTISAEALGLDTDDLNSLTQSIQATIHKLNGKKGDQIQVIFDISSCSGALILSVIQTVIRHELPTKLTIVYTQAQTYFPSKEDYDAAAEKVIEAGSELKEIPNVFAESGAQEPSVHPLFPGHHNDARPDYILAFPSFRSTRLVRCLDSFGEQLLSAPDRGIFWVFGRPRFDADEWRTHLQREIVARTFEKLGVTENLGEGWFTDSNSDTCCAFDYREAAQKLLNLCDRELGKNISLIPMGTKLQTVGLSLALLVREEVAVVTARPNSFNAAAYSIGVGDSWKIDLPPSTEIMSILSRVGTLFLRTDKGIAAALPYGESNA